ncbi:hypothetical protein O1V66_00530 [Rouxiella chamberiensis]|uniref:Amino acid ABC transporter permease n=1 Tax=Rouxiella chamberiensis TaxID=1513468 RepID=A0ABY7HPS8_9GAMM|nr:hypothetical protein [Rouxiella chamberiensis]WAT01350.1 hypothetical protein O1V66_00530 [Rouxiella chamberiensis]
MQDFFQYLTLPYLWQGAVIAVELLVGALTGGIIIGFFWLSPALRAMP